MKGAYKAFQKLNIQWRQDEDNVTLQLEVNTAKQRYQNMKKAVKDLQSDADEMNPEAAAARIQAEKERVEVLKRE